MQLPQFYIDDLIRRAITEDINYIDVTTDYLIDPQAQTTAYFVAKDNGVLCGLSIAMRVFELLDPSITYQAFFQDGAHISKGDRIAQMQGSALSLLKGERTALNLLQHLSGIATATDLCVRQVSGTNASVAETRKTLPGLRALQKYAVVVGGGRNHRFNLSDAAMIKDNHIDACGGIENAVSTLRARVGHMVKIEVEVRDFDELEKALKAGADVIMLDNMSCEQMRRAVNMIDGRAKTEASGNITLENIGEVARTGVDIISLGALTHSVKAFDISMKIL